MRVFFRWVVCSLLLWAAAAITNSFGGVFSIEVHGILTAPIAVALLSLANLVIGPLVWLLTFPLRCCTFGLVSIVLNGVIFYLVARLVPGLEVGSFWDYQEGGETYRAEILAIEDITVPAGLFRDCVMVWRHRLTGSNPSLGMLEWFSVGFMLVQEIKLGDSPMILQQLRSIEWLDYDDNDDDD